MDNLQVSRINPLSQAEMENIKRSYQEMLALTRENTAGVQEYARVHGDSMNQISSQLEATRNGTKSLQDSFKGMTDSVLSDMTRMVSQQAMSGLNFGLANFLGGFAEGGVLPGEFMPVTPMASGGVFSRPTLGLVGEAGYPEAVIPMKDGNIPVKMTGDNSQGQGSGHTYIVNAFSEDFLQQQISKALAQNSEVILNVIQGDISQGGATYRAIRNIK